MRDARRGEAGLCVRQEGDGKRGAETFRPYRISAPPRCARVTCETGRACWPGHSGPAEPPSRSLHPSNPSRLGTSAPEQCLPLLSFLNPATRMIQGLALSHGEPGPAGRG